MEYKDAHIVDRACSICGMNISDSHLPAWLYELKNLAALNLGFNPILCKDCYNNYRHTLAKTAMLAVMDRINHCKSDQS